MVLSARLSGSHYLLNHCLPQPILTLLLSTERYISSFGVDGRDDLILMYLFSTPVNSYTSFETE